MSNFIRQCEEFECIMSMFPDPKELLYDRQLIKEYIDFAPCNGDEPSARLHYTICFCVSILLLVLVVSTNTLIVACSGW